MDKMSMVGACKLQPQTNYSIICNTMHIPYIKFSNIYFIHPLFVGIFCSLGGHHDQ